MHFSAGSFTGWGSEGVKAVFKRDVRGKLKYGIVGLFEALCSVSCV